MKRDIDFNVFCSLKLLNFYFLETVPCEHFYSKSNNHSKFKAFSLISVTKIQISETFFAASFYISNILEKVSSRNI